MAKDRFSRFKKSNYNNEFRWGTHEYNSSWYNDRVDLLDNQREWVINLIKSNKTNKWEMEFLRSILVDGKVPTDKQKDIIRKIVKK